MKLIDRFIDRFADRIGQRVAHHISAQQQPVLIGTVNNVRSANEQLEKALRNQGRAAGEAFSKGMPCPHCDHEFAGHQ